MTNRANTRVRHALAGLRWPALGDVLRAIAAIAVMANLGSISVSITPALAAEPKRSASAAAPTARLTQPVGDTLERKMRGMAQALIDAGAPGILLRVRQGRRVVVLARGHRDIEAPSPVVPETAFRVASITKILTAHIVNDLATRGFLDLNAPVGTILDGLPKWLAARPIRSLLNHTSRVREHLPQSVFGVTARDMAKVAQTPRDTDALLSEALRAPLRPEPTSKHRYANGNYVLLQLVAEAVSGLSLKALVKTRLLKPLGLLATGFVGPAGQLPKNHLHGYIRDDVGRAPFASTLRLLDVTRHPYFAGGDGGLWTTVDDLGRILDHIWRVNSDRDVPLARLTRDLVTDHEGSYRYGHGIMEIQLACGQTIYGHTGLGLGIVTNAFATRDNARQLIVAVNLSLDLNPQLDRRMLRLINTFFCP